MAMRLLAALVAFLAIATPACAQVTEGDDAPLRFGRFEYRGEVHYGVLASGGLHRLDRSFFEPDAKVTGEVLKLEDVKLLPPVVPTKVIGVARNYPGQYSARGDEPNFFAKLPSALVGMEAVIVPPPGSKELHFEGEMVVVMGRRAKNVGVEEAGEYIFGVTAGNDVTERSYPFEPFHVLRAKGFDTSGPLGPWIVPGLSYDRLKLLTKLNGKVVQQASTSEMLWKTAEIVAALSRYMTLEPGDVIFTGTPGRTLPMKAGDVVEVVLEGVGTLRNRVEAEKGETPKPR